MIENMVFSWSGTPKSSKGLIILTGRASFWTITLQQITNGTNEKNHQSDNLWETLGFPQLSLAKN